MFYIGTACRKRACFDAPDRLLCDDRLVALRPAVAEELPGIPDLADHVQVKVCDDERVLVPWGLRYELAARVAEVALAVEFAYVPRLLVAYAVDSADEVTVGDGVRRLL